MTIVNQFSHVLNPYRLAVLNPGFLLSLQVVVVGAYGLYWNLIQISVAYYGIIQSTNFVISVVLYLSFPIIEILVIRALSALVSSLQIPDMYI